jgi:hypothetical protein
MSPGNDDVSNQNSGGGSIVAKPPIRSPNASGAPNNLNFRDFDSPTIFSTLPDVLPGVN